MSRNPRRFAEPTRLIASVEAKLVAAIDRTMTQGRHHGHRNRAEFVRLAIEGELARCQCDNGSIFFKTNRNQAEGARGELDTAQY
ncbi:hypothetical protein [Billgrantia antri]|uniref:hypothetical protein n=1 Tax=Billgrantia antri TaxID=2846777 RepID=UPI003B224EEF